MPVGALYVRKYFREETRRATVDMVKTIRNEFINILRDAAWLDESTREEAIKKAKSMDGHIGYPNELHDNKKLEEYYKDLELEPDNFFMNTLQMYMFNSDRRFSKLREPADNIEWEITTVNAFNIPNGNSIGK